MRDAVAGPSQPFPRRSAQLNLSDGDTKVLFVTRPVGNLRIALIDLAEPDGLVVVHRSLIEGAVPVDSSGLETWGRDGAQGLDAPFVDEGLRYNSLAGRLTITDGYLSDTTQVPANAL